MKVAVSTRMLDDPLEASQAADWCPARV